MAREYVVHPRWRNLSDTLEAANASGRHLTSEVSRAADEARFATGMKRRRLH